MIFLFVREKTQDVQIPLTTVEPLGDAEENTEDKARLLPRALVQFFWHFGLAVSALFLASLKLTSGVSPFGLALVAALAPSYGITAAFGAATGYILTEGSVSALRYVAALISVAVLSKLLYTLEQGRHLRAMPALIAFCASFLTAAAVLTAEGLTLGGFTSALTEALCTAAATFAFTAAGEAVVIYKQEKQLSSALAPFVAFSLFILLSTVSDLAVFGVSFSRMLSITLLLLFLYIYKGNTAALLGLSVALPFLLDDAVGMAAFSYMLASTAVGYVKNRKLYVSALTFVTTFGFCLLFLDIPSRLPLFLEAIGGALLFLATPKRLLHSGSVCSAEETPKETGEAQRAELFLRLRSASDAMRGIAETVETVSTVLPEVTPHLSAEEEATLYTKQTVCSSCPLFHICTEKHEEETEGAFQKMKTSLKEDRFLLLGDLPPVFRSRCPQAEHLCESMNRQFLRLSERKRNARTVEELRAATAKNFTCLSAMLERLSREVSEEITFDYAAEETARRAVFRECNLRTQAISCTKEENRLFLELLFTDKAEALHCKAKILSTLSDALSLDFDPPEIVEEGNGVRFKIAEKTLYGVEAGASRIIPDNGKYSGDSYESFYDGRGNYIAVLSDGMGQGKRAALDSALAVTFLIRLLKGGASPEHALQSANALLLLKSEEESLATLDVLKINLYTGKAVFYKAGAAKSLLKRGKKIQSIESASLPAGILEEVNFERTEGLLAAEDLAIMASDGAFDYAEKEVESALASCHAEPAEEIAQKLSDTALKQAPKGHADDITVLTLRLFQKSEI